ncbi:hypothetical protein POM88_046988 [Heracleum sosnowskyi]|uniref:Uncharacterized protein n=1 Tax=Heracleum sosnowskyi TaxID=360622 RepID=A0AAD8H8K3_9APIA|nr:hypothetical protein POM88_046988 [Heracleum sosnowskyi]
MGFSWHQPQIQAFRLSATGLIICTSRSSLSLVILAFLVIWDPPAPPCLSKHKVTMMTNIIIVITLLLISMTQIGFTKQIYNHIYQNGIDGSIPNQWQAGNSDLSYQSMRSSENDNFSYHIPEYSNMVCGANGYTVFRPSSGH